MLVKFIPNRNGVSVWHNVVPTEIAQQEEGIVIYNTSLGYFGRLAFIP
jgi:hypothetical protein